MTVEEQSSNQLCFVIVLHSQCGLYQASDLTLHVMFNTVVHCNVVKVLTLHEPKKCCVDV